MKAALKFRTHNLFQIRNSTAALAKLHFVTLLHARSYSGNLKFDYSAQKLDIDVSITIGSIDIT